VVELRPKDYYFPLVTPNERDSSPSLCKPSTFATRSRKVRRSFLALLFKPISIPSCASRASPFRNFQSL